VSNDEHWQALFLHALVVFVQRGAGVNADGIIVKVEIDRSQAAFINDAHAVLADLAFGAVWQARSTLTLWNAVAANTLHASAAIFRSGALGANAGCTASLEALAIHAIFIAGAAVAGIAHRGLASVASATECTRAVAGAVGVCPALNALAFNTVFAVARTLLVCVTVRILLSTSGKHHCPSGNSDYAE